MAMSLGVFNGTLAGGRISLAHKANSGMTLFPAVALPADLHNAGFSTVATASKPVTAETKKRGEPRGIMKPRRVSPEMQAFLGVLEISRTEALKKIWAYIKHQDLQDPENKKVIICDEQLKKIFGGKDRVGFLEIAGLISPHFLK